MLKHHSSIEYRFIKAYTNIINTGFVPIKNIRSVRAMNEISQLKQQFIQVFGGNGDHIRVFHAPGRVNLIGEHTDYNGGYVFPAALTFGTTMLIRKRNDRKLGLVSTNFELAGTIDLTKLQFIKEDDWMNYPKGVVYYLEQHGYAIGGYDILYCGKIPNGSGLSSSASIEVVTGFGLLSMEGHQIDTVQLSLLAQEAENKFIGVNCGIMDQFAVANGKKDHAILLMCDTLEFQHVPFNSGAYKIVIGNTNKRRGLVESEYNTRRSQCEQAVHYLQAQFPNITLLGQITLEQYNANEHLIPEEIIRKRARHVIEEIDRVLQSIKVLENNDLQAFGQLMIASHRSLQHLYEVTGNELDSMVDAALQAPGVLGSRMTGAGFGGCTVSLVHEDHIENFTQYVSEQYTLITGLIPTFYVCDIGDGVKEVYPS
jgi:galactokinase